MWPCRLRWHRPVTGMQHADGKFCGPGCRAFGVPTLSTMSICSIEDVAAYDKAVLVQLYVMRDRKFVHQLIERARGAMFRVDHHG